MHIGAICTRDVVVCTPTTAIVDACRLMREHHVGDLIVIEERQGKRIPAGVVTDRDIVTEIIALAVPLERVVIGDIMSREVVSMEESRDAFEALEIMQRKGIRRVPVVDAHNALVGVVTLDDLLELLAEELGAIAKLISRQPALEAKHRPMRPMEELWAKH